MCQSIVILKQIDLLKKEILNNMHLDKHHILMVCFSLLGHFLKVGCFLNIPDFPTILELTTSVWVKLYGVSNTNIHPPTAI